MTRSSGKTSTICRRSPHREKKLFSCCTAFKSNKYDGSSFIAHHNTYCQNLTEELYIVIQFSPTRTGARLLYFLFFFCYKSFFLSCMDSINLINTFFSCYLHQSVLAKSDIPYLYSVLFS